MSIEDPVDAPARLACARTCFLVTEDRTKEVTIILHEHATLTGEARAQHQRPQEALRALPRDLIHRSDPRRTDCARYDPKVAAFSFLGQVLWIYKWFRADGVVPAEELAIEMEKVFFDGLVTRAEPPEEPAQHERIH